MKYIKGAKIITETQVLEGYVLGFDQKFRKLIEESYFNSDGAEVINAENLYVAPGLIDLHIHGSGGFDTMLGTEEALNAMSTTIIKNGVTAFLPTTMTMSREIITNALVQIKNAMHKKMPGAQVLGAHLEGPFINEKFKGAQAAEHIISPDWSLVEPFIDVIKLVTIAPESNGAIDFISRLKENGTVVSLGHSAATYEQAMQAAYAGASHITHLFNAMSGVHHRNPGVASAALSSDFYCEIIADKIHTHPSLFQLVKNAKGAEKIVLVTDCIEAGGMPDGQYSLGGQPVFVKNNAARLEDGTLAGSILKLNTALYNFYKNTDIKLHEVFWLASLNPAIELRLDNKKGSIAVAKDADFFLMDEHFNVKATYVNGCCEFEQN